MRSARALWFALALPVLATGCGISRSSLAVGTVNSIIVIAVDSLWQQVADSVRADLERPVFTVREERTFQVTQVSPLSENWLDLRKFKQVLVIGVPGDSWVSPTLSHGAPAQLPAVVEATDVWARQQSVVAIVVPGTDAGAAVLRVLPGVARQYDERFRAYVRQRMFLSGQDTLLRDSLRATAGFSLLFPTLYTHEVDGSVHIFRNSTQMQGDLFRTVLVTWRQGTDSLSAAGMLAWRDTLARKYYNPPQITQPEPIRVGRVGPDSTALQVHGVWRSSDSTLIAAGPFIDRLVSCPDRNRTYLLDAWLYAPGKDKYEYVIQLETILDSFTCGGGSPARESDTSRAGPAV